MNATTINWSGSPVGRPTSDTLTDRYIWAVLKSLPEEKRLDIDRELRASIADEVDARVATGEAPAAAEHAVLLEFGEPAKLAASYTGRTLALIGPELYLDYVRLLKMLYLLVLPVGLVGYAVVQVMLGTPVGGVIGGTVGLAVSIIVHVGFWTTLIFVVVERTGSAGLKGSMSPGGPNVAYDPRQLPSIRTVHGAGRSDLIASLVFLLLIPIAFVWDQIAPFARNADGTSVPVLTPSMWNFWLPYFLVLTVLAAVQAVVLYRAGRWTWPLVLTNAALAIAATAPLVGLILNGALINRAFLDALGWTAAVAQGSPGATATSAALIVIAIWAVGDSVWKAVKAERLAARA